MAASPIEEPFLPGFRDMRYTYMFRMYSADNTIALPDCWHALMQADDCRVGQLTSAMIPAPAASAGAPEAQHGEGLAMPVPFLRLLLNDSALHSAGIGLPDKEPVSFGSRRKHR